MDKIKTQLQDEKIAMAMNNACVKLPENYTLSVNVENNKLFILLFDPDGNDIKVENSDCPSEDINNAVAKAIEFSKINPLDEFLRDTMGEDAYLFTSDGSNGLRLYNEVN